MSVEDGARVVALRSGALRELAGQGAMASLALDVAEAEGFLPSSVTVAAVNGPGQIVVSGPPEEIAELCVRLDGLGVRARRIEVDYASHHAQVEQIAGELRAGLDGLSSRGSGVTMWSTVTGEAVQDEELDAAYWYHNLRQPVLFETAVRAARAHRHAHFIELSPHPVLGLALSTVLADGSGDGHGRVLHSLRRDQPEAAQLLRSLGAAWAAGLPVVWRELLPVVEPVALPTYAFQRARYWLDAPPPAEVAVAGSGVDAWRYRVGWTPLAVRHSGGLHRKWLLLCHDLAGAGEVRQALEQAGAQVEVRVLPDGHSTDRGEIARLLMGAEHIAYLPAGFDGCPQTGTETETEIGTGTETETEIGTGTGTEAEIGTETETGTGTGTEAAPGLSVRLAVALSVMQAVAEVEGARLWVVTRGAVSAPGNGSVPDPVLAAVWGLGRVFGLEHSGHYGGLVDLPAVWQAGTGGLLVAALAQSVEDQLAVGVEGVFVRRLRRAPASVAGRDVRWRPSGTVLVTGGTGGLGSHLARWLARSGAEHVVLVSRSGARAPGAVALAEELTAAGTPTTVRACDITDAGQLAEVLGGTGHPPITTVIHAAATIELARLRDATPEHLSTVLDAKCTGAAHLADLLGADHPDVRLVLFSSIAGIWGSGVHGAYAAANAYLDALAESRAATQPITSVAWGIWDTELALGRVDPDQMYRQGLPFLDRDRALDALAQVLAGEEAVLAIAEVDWPTFVPVFTAARPRPLLSELPEVRALEPAEQDSTAPATSSSPLVERLATATEAERDAALLEMVRTEAASVLGHTGLDDIGPHRALRDVGFDSLTAVDLRNRLSAALGVRLPATVVFDYPRPLALAAFLKAEVWGGRPATDSSPRAVAFDSEPLAIVGMSCRLPGGVHSAEDLWDLLSAQRETVSGFPADRGWDAGSLHHPDREGSNGVSARGGGFLHDAALFDPEFFGISPREARAMDPQQRLLLETAWEAFEHAGIDPESLAGTPTGVFVGSNYQDYGANLAAVPEGTEGHLLTGGASSVLSGRIAYTFGLEGPAVTVDTACSSSLVGVHLAAQALRLGECSLALAGGVAVMGSPGALLAFSKQGALSPDGRCRSFSAEADGMGMAEGVGLLLLERLSEAVANGHQVLAVVRGSAVNQDGASNGLTAPNGPSQQRVIRQALANAQVDAGEVDAVEAHGTGTTLGDPIEAQALLATYGKDRPEGRPLWLGSVKSNIGHTQAASGVTGVIKMVMALRHHSLPATLHADTPSPHVDWATGDVRLLTEAVPWRAEGRPRRAGVSSFGVSGTNVHMILEEAPAAGVSTAQEPTAGAPMEGVLQTPALLGEGQQVPWVVSGRGDAGLRGQAARLASFVRAQQAAGAVDRAWITGVAAGLAGRSALEQRAVVVGADVRELLAGLDELAEDGRPSPGRTTDLGVVFVFPGQGGQWIGMGRELLLSCPVFAERMDACERALDPWVDWSLSAVLSGEERGWLGRVDVVQPVLWAVMVSLAEVWRAAGVVPDAVVGHSQGEIAAAVVAGRLSVEDGARVVALRSGALRELAGQGAMASLALDVAEAEGFLPSSVTVAAVNGPGQIVVSGPPEEIAELCVRLDGLGVRARRIEVDYASHHAQVEQIAGELRAGLDGLSSRGSGVTMWSTVTGEAVQDEELDAAYWYHNLRQPVLFADVVRRLEDAGPWTFVEIGPHPVLSLPMEQTVTDGRVLHTLRRHRPETAQLFTSLGAAWAAGLPVVWRDLLPAVEPVALPTYAFQRQRYWLDAPASTADVAPAGLTPTDHPLLTAMAVLPGDDARLFVGRIAPHTHAWLRPYMTSGSVVVPPAVVAEMALHAGRSVHSSRLANLTIVEPLVFPADESVQVQLVVSGPDDEGDRRVDLHSRPADGMDADWRGHATGLLRVHPGDAPAPVVTPWPPADAEPIAEDVVRHALSEGGYDTEDVLARLGRLWRSGDDLLAEGRVPAGEELASDRFTHALLQAVGALTMEATPEPRLASHWRDLVAVPGFTGDVRARVTPTGPDTRSLHLTGADGTPVADVGELTLRPPTAAQARAWHRPLHRLVWEALGVPAQPPVPGRYAVVGGEEDHLFKELRRQGADVRPCAEPAEATGAETVLVPVGPVGTPAPGQAHTAVARLLPIVQSWLADERFADGRLLLVTRSAVATDGGDVADLAGAAVWGLARSIQAEHPGRLVVVDIDERDESVRALPAVPATGQPQAALRAGALFVPRLRPVPRSRAVEGRKTGEAPLLDPSGTVLVTGATGTLGGLVARHLVHEHGASRLLLVGRRGATAPGMPALVGELTGAGADVTVESCDVGDRDALAAVLGAVPAAHPLTAVIHTAGVLDDGIVTSLTGDRFASVFRPKADAAWHLHELTREQPALRTFVLFSSAASTLGTPGQGNYAAANAFLDGLAHRRRAEGLPATSVAWGLWAERSGMTQHLGEDDVRRILGGGAAEMSSAEGLALFDAALAADLPFTVAGVDTTRRAAAVLPPVLWETNGAVPRTAAGAAPGSETFAQRLAGLPEREREEAVLTLVRRTVADVLTHADAERVDPDRAFKELGFDSLTAMELRNRLAAAIEHRLSASLVFDFPTPRALAAHVRGELFGSAVIDPVFAHLAELHTTLAALEADEAVRDRLVARLQGLVAVLTDTATHRGRPPEPDTDDDSDIQAATADEVFAILDQEFDDSAAPYGPQGGSAR
nr:type I polyketide synthase [Streptomyces sp. McG3]